MHIFQNQHNTLPGISVIFEILIQYAERKKYVKMFDCRPPQCFLLPFAGHGAYGSKVYQPNRILILIRESLEEDSIRSPFSSLLCEATMDVSQNHKHMITYTIIVYIIICYYMYRYMPMVLWQSYIHIFFLRRSLSSVTQLPQNVCANIGN